MWCVTLASGLLPCDRNQHRSESVHRLQMFQACLQKYQFDSRVQDVFEDMNLNSAHLLQNAHPSIKSDEPQPSPARAIAGDREPDAEGPQ